MARASAGITLPEENVCRVAADHEARGQTPPLTQRLFNRIPLPVLGKKEEKCSHAHDDEEDSKGPGENK